jgi:TctA family transporter
MGRMSFLAVLIGVTSWELEKIALDKGIQFLPILLAMFGLGQLYILHRAVRQESPQMAHLLDVV